MGNLHLYVEQAEPNMLAATKLECKDCGVGVSLDIREAKFSAAPVQHCMQTFNCSACGAVHFVLTGGSHADCKALEPLVPELAKIVRRHMA